MPRISRISRRWPDATVALKVWLDNDHGEITLSRACGLVWNCTNLLPMDVKIRIDSIAGEQMKGLTYAIGARRLIRLINWHMFF
jgi:hypothetical protein